MRRIAAAAVAIGVLAASPAGASLQGERFVGNAMAMGGVSGTSRIEFHIERWSTDEERSHFLAVLAESGQEALVPELQNVEVGRARVGTRNTYPISYAYQMPLDDGGRRVVLVTDRPIGALEAMGRASTMEWAVSVVEMRFPPDGNGEGALVVAGAIHADATTQTLSLENYGQAPVRLRNVRSE
jgi:hypothetical protein